MANLHMHSDEPTRIALVSRHGAMQRLECVADAAGDSAVLEGLDAELGQLLLGGTLEDSLVWVTKQLCRRLGVNFAFVGALHGSDLDKVRTLSLMTSGGPVDNFEYALEGTPCEEVLDRDTCVFGSSVAALFPEDVLLVEMGVESYVGMPVHDQGGRPLGLFVIMDSGALSDAQVQDGLTLMFRLRGLVRELLTGHRLRRDLTLVGSPTRQSGVESPLQDALVGLSKALITRGGFVVTGGAARSFGADTRLVVWDGEAVPSDRLKLDEAWMLKVSEQGLQVPRMVETGAQVLDADGRSLGRDAWLLIPLFDGSGELLGLAGVLHDMRISRRIATLPVVKGFGARIAFELEKQLHASTRQREAQRALELERTESLGLLAGGVAHDFNNLLVSVSGNTQLLLADPPKMGGQDRVEILTDIQNAASAASDLCKQLMAYAGGVTLEPRPVDLCGEIEGVARLNLKGRQDRVLLSSNERSEDLWVDGDPIRIRQVAMNLINNGLDASGPSGTVRVELSRQELTANRLPEITVGTLEPGHYAVLRVEDSGHGMSERLIHRIFDPFFSTKDTGHGLGLAGVLATVRSHNGAIRVVSIPEQGTTFEVFFPSLVRVGNTEGEEVESEPAKTRDRVLVVDDDPMVRRLNERFVKRLGLTPISADGGESALRLVELNRDELVLVLMDSAMPRITGDEVLSALQDAGLEAPCVFLSGSVRPSEGALALTKPYSYDDFAKTVVSALRESRFVGQKQLDALFSGVATLA